MVTTRACHAKKLSGAELDDDDGDNHGMSLEDFFDDGTNQVDDDGDGTMGDNDDDGDR
jgi:hypothetical protein